MAKQNEEVVRYQSPVDAARAIGGLSSLDLVKLERLARARSAGLYGVDWADLLNEAFSRILSGSRRWPSDVPFIAFVAQTLRSLASEQWRQIAAWPLVASSSEDASGLPVSIPDEQPGQESALVARQFLGLILEAVDDDPDVKAVVAGLEFGETASQTIERTAMTPQQYDAARKRLRRLVDRLASRHGYFE